ncbi:MAG: DUF4747 family protein [Magnetococcales bacterium]|nr:DUF4747 family protein [Magnetococcales bacterium]
MNPPNAPLIDNHHDILANFPDYLKPHCAFSQFAFFPDIHKLFFISKNEDGKVFSPNFVSKSLSSMFNDRAHYYKHGKVNVTPIPSKDALDRILDAPLHRLEIDIKLPNPDDFGNLESDLFNDMVELNAGELKVELIARTEPLAPSQKYVKLAQVGSTNGRVTGYYRPVDSRSLKKISTSDHPELYDFKFNPGFEREGTSFISHI